MNKPPEFFVAIAVGVLIVLHRTTEKSRATRTILGAISAGMAYSLAPEIAEWSGRSEVLAAIVVGGFGYTLLDAVNSLIADRDFLKQIILKRLGK